jgi:hypothetical protein
MAKANDTMVASPETRRDASHHVASHRIASHCIVSHRIASYRIACRQRPLHHMLSQTGSATARSTARSHRAVRNLLAAVAPVAGAEPGLRPSIIMQEILDGSKDRKQSKNTKICAERWVGGCCFYFAGVMFCRRHRLTCHNISPVTLKPHDWFGFRRTEGQKQQSTTALPSFWLALPAQPGS